LIREILVLCADFARSGGLYAREQEMGEKEKEILGLDKKSARW